MPSVRDIKAGAAYVELTLRDGALARGLHKAQRKLRAFSGMVSDLGRRLTRLADVEAGRVAVIAVYKRDRLSRSQKDFVNLLGFLEEHDVAFVSVTQHFNTTTSMGRLMLDTLISFAQFERENMIERVKDTIGDGCGDRRELFGDCLFLG